jgi:hypothetical protein
MAQVIRYVDPDASGAADGTSWTDAYTSLSAWNTGEGTNLVTDGDYHTCYCRSSGGTEDTTEFTLSGWTTGASNYIEIRGADFPATGIWDASAYILHGDDGGVYNIVVEEDYVRFHNLQFKVTTTGATVGVALDFVNNSAQTHFIDSCLFRGVCSGTGQAYGLVVSHATAAIDVTVYNTVFYDFVSGADAQHIAVYQAGTNSQITVYNSVAYNNYAGFWAQNGNIDCYNTVSGNNTDDWFSGTQSYCASDDGSVGDANHQSPSGGSWANEFNNAGSGDFSLVLTGNCYNNGDDDPSSGIYSDDIIGRARSSPWSIGAYEAGSSLGFPYTHHYMQIGGL